MKVSALNIYGTSGYSQIGNGALIQLVPNAPISLSNDAAQTLSTQIGLTWSEGASNGGSAVLDYRIYYDQTTGTWVELDSGIATNSYVTTVTLTQGMIYSFRV
jgi:hypothetical protein